MTTLGLSMIVRDAARDLPRCLDSVRSIVDEMVIADTGSRDASREVARSFGARTMDISWNDDFAEARNQCLAAMRSDWVLVLDADEMLDENDGTRVRGLLNAGGPAGYQVTIRNFVLTLQDRVWDKAALPNDTRLAAGRRYPAYVDHHNVRLFRNEPAIRFRGRVHESVGPVIAEQKRAIGAANFPIYHFGLAAAGEERAAKNRYYRELGRQKLREMPRDAQAHLELGLVEMDNFGDVAEALRLFREACRLNPRFGAAWFFQGVARIRQNDFSGALDCLRQAEEQGHRTALVAETRGDALYNGGAYRDAATAYQTALRRDPGNPWLTSKLGLALVRCGEALPGLRHLLVASEQRPEAPELYDRKVFALLALDRCGEAASAMEEKLAKVAAPSANDFLRTASLWSKSGEWRRAASVVEEGLRRFPEDKSLLSARLELSFHVSQPNEGEAVSRPAPSTR